MSYQIDTEEHTSAVKITYDEMAQQYVDVPEDFLARLNLLRPGDSVSGEIQIENSDDDEHEIWLGVEASEEGLGGALIVKIERDGAVLYEGPLANLGEHSLGKYAAGEKATIVISLSLPVEAGNEVGGLRGVLNWNFRVDRKEESIPDDTPRTNDDIMVAATVFLASLVGLIIVSIIERFSQKEEQESVKG